MATDVKWNSFSFFFFKFSSKHLLFCLYTNLTITFNLLYAKMTPNYVDFVHDSHWKKNALLQILDEIGI